MLSECPFALALLLFLVPGHVAPHVVEVRGHGVAAAAEVQVVREVEHGVAEVVRDREAVLREEGRVGRESPNRFLLFECLIL